MMKQLRMLFVCLCLPVFALAFVAQGEEKKQEALYLELPTLFSDHGLLQRECPLPVWGWSEPGALVRVQFGEDVKAEATAGEDGRWQATLPAQQASMTGRTLEVSAQSAQGTTPARQAKRTFTDVLVGDVWLCSGQSNMEWGLKGCTEWWVDANGADLPGVRLFFEPHHARMLPGGRSYGNWRVCSPGVLWSDAPKSFSAIAFIFGREVHKATGVPVGLIESALGNTAIAPWCTQEVLKQYAAPELRTEPAPWLLGRFEEEWKKMDPAYEASLAWRGKDFDDKAWPTVKLPALYGDSPELKSFSGVVWFRKRIQLPAEWAGKELRLRIGQVDNSDAVWLNGQFLGGQESRNVEQEYLVPAGAVQAGENVLVLRVDGRHGFLVNHNGTKTGERFTVRPAAQPWVQAVDFSGEWSVMKSTPTKDLKGGRTIPTRWAPSSCYYGSILPLAPFALKGFTWYQGEGNGGNSANYDKILEAMIGSWRATFRNPEAPFYIVQLSGFGKQPTVPEDSGWAIVREMQADVAARVKNSGLAVSIDRGSIITIHPLDKQDVGKRLALAALAKTYGKPVTYSGPVYRELKTEGNRLRLLFDHAEGGLFSYGGGPTGLAVAGADGKYYWACAEVDGESLLVFSDKVPAPVSVRYGWAENPVCNLYNKDGLPMVPFRTNRNDRKK